MRTLNSISLALATTLALACGNLFAQANNTDIKITGNHYAPAAVNADWRWSRTPNGGYDHVHIRDTKVQPVPWQNIREKDMQWKKRVWREINTLEKQNVAFNYPGDEHTGGGMLIEIFIDAIKTGKVEAYATTDNRFCTVFTREELEAKIRGKADTIYLMDPIGDSEIMSVTYKDFNPATITKYRIIEDWMFDNNTGQMVVRIAGIAPVRDIYDDKNQFRGSQAMFWLYYPDVRGVLAGYEVVNPTNDVERVTWVDYFEGRRFSSHITKVSNPYGSVAGSYGESFTEKGMEPMEALYEGQRAAVDISNKEHDVWTY